MSECSPNCTGKICGDDGCGGKCGVCPESKVCEKGACVPDRRPTGDPYHAADTASSIGTVLAVSALAVAGGLVAWIFWPRQS